MNNYIDIKILPDQEFSPNMIINALFAKFHRALVEAGYGEVGVSFPQAQKTLGDTFRIHGNQDALQRLMAIGWLKGLTDYICVTAINAVPDSHRYRVVKRVQAKSNVERIYRRSVKKGWLTTEEAKARMNSSKEQQLKLPFVQLNSLSSRQSFRLFIKQGKFLDAPVKGLFSAYGLSDVASIPWF